MKLFADNNGQVFAYATDGSQAHLIEGKTSITQIEGLSPSRLNSRALGVGQAWEDCSASRTVGVSYTNSTGNPIMIALTTGVNNTGATGANFTVDGLIVASTIGGAAGIGMAMNVCYSVVVPNGSTYIAGNAQPGIWAELR